MATYDDDARIYADLIRDKNRLKAQIASGAMVAYQIKKDDSGRFTIKDWMPVIRARASQADLCIYDHPINGIYGYKYDVGRSGAGRLVEIMRRRWEWTRKQDFSQVKRTFTLSGDFTQINAENNTHYLSSQTLEI